MQKNMQPIMGKIGIKELFIFPHGRLQGNTVIATNGKQNLTVSQLMKSITYLLEFIKYNFDVNQYKYSVAIKFLKSMQLVLNNGDANKPTKEDAHIIIDVIHEIADINAQSNKEKRFNAEVAISLKSLIEILK